MHHDQDDEHDQEEDEMLPDMGRVRAGVRTTRDAAGRAGTAVGAAALVAAAATGDPALMLALPVTAAATLGGYAVSVPRDPRPHWLLRGLYLTPGATLTVQLLAAQAAGGWWQWATAAAWSGLVWTVRPARWARDLITPPATAPTGVETVHTLAGGTAETGPGVDLTGPLDARLASWWTTLVACDGGAAPGTHLEQITVAGPREWSAHIVARPGEPVGDIPVARLSALTDIPAGLIALGDVPGSGAGRRQIRVGTSAPADFAGLWAQRIAPRAMPGTTVTAIRYGTADGAEIPQEQM
ncbi:hypothetical protein [Streptomyces sp. NPDC049879]|uniref:hypothetical protein n=1 Tax=Streptomyces sp. NPDC049879 TaxID=3365598 RepID=UPI0037AAE57F